MHTIIPIIEECSNTSILGFFLSKEYRIGIIACYKNFLQKAQNQLLPENQKSHKNVYELAIHGFITLISTNYHFKNLITLIVLILLPYKYLPADPSIAKKMFLLEAHHHSQTELCFQLRQQHMQMTYYKD